MIMVEVLCPYLHGDGLLPEHDVTAVDGALHDLDEELVLRARLEGGGGARRRLRPDRLTAGEEDQRGEIGKEIS